MRRLTALLGIFAVLAFVALGVLLGAPERALAQSRGNEILRTYTGSISASNAAVTSLVAAGDLLVVRSMVVSSSQAGTLTFTDGTSGNAVLHVYVAANVRVDLGPTLLGAAGIKLTRGNELYVNALSSATISLAMSTGLE